MNSTTSPRGDAASLGSAPVVVRIPADDSTWPRWLPAVPRGHEVTVSVSDVRLAEVAADDLIGSGYVLVGVVTTGLPLGGRRVLDLLVDVDLAADHPRWWARVRSLADRTFVTSFGPVAAALAPVLDSHASVIEARSR